MLGQTRSESGGRASCHAPNDTRVKEPPGGAFHYPAAGIRQAIYPPQRIRQRNVEEKGPWRGSRRDKSPEFPEPGLRKEVWRTEGVSTFSLGVLVRGHGIHITPPVLVVLELALHQKLRSNGIRDKVYQHV